MKKCSKCGKLKAKVDFHCRADVLDGLSYLCKGCGNAASRKYRKLRTPEHELLRKQEKERKDALAAKNLRQCARCKLIMSLSAFYNNIKGSQGKSYWCAKCEKDFNKEAYPKNREDILKKRRARQPIDSKNALNSLRKRRYGVLPEDFDQIVLNQGNKCAVCKRPFVKTPNLDHDHSTGKIRGALCSPCNTGLGLFKDSPETLRAAVVYLEKL